VSDNLVRIGNSRAYACEPLLKRLDCRMRLEITLSRGSHHTAVQKHGLAWAEAAAALCRLEVLS